MDIAIIFTSSYEDCFDDSKQKTILREKTVYNNNRYIDGITIIILIDDSSYSVMLI